MSDSVQPHRWQPSRLPYPWDSPGKNTGVGCHFLLQSMKVKSKVKSLSRVQLLATSWTAAYQAPLSMGFSRQEYWSGVPTLPSLQRSLECCYLWDFKGLDTVQQPNDIKRLLSVSKDYDCLEASVFSLLGYFFETHIPCNEEPKAYGISIQDDLFCCIFISANSHSAYGILKAHPCSLCSFISFPLSACFVSHKVECCHLSS